MSLELSPAESAGSQSGSDFGPIHGSTPWASSQSSLAGIGVTSPPVTAAAIARCSARGRVAPPTLATAAIRRSAASTVQAARSRASMSCTGVAGRSGTSTLPSGFEGCANRHGQYTPRPDQSPGPPIRLTRATCARSGPTASSRMRSHAAFAAPYSSIDAMTSWSRGSCSAIDSSPPTIDASR